uniref:Golgi apparatus membrane protein TVP23 homolog n=1 Tax=Albugo laibachii Nc14 TaxID=890382 RepID=F0WX45_9STRA|nr:conserved hypothetical protein [Albugo laibachii Nc14]|eukprot:CCA26035.1 conserved hypothetical protein [Albugo laibachii Nc14]
MMSDEKKDLEGEDSADELEFIKVQVDDREDGSIPIAQDAFPPSKSSLSQFSSTFTLRKAHHPIAGFFHLLFKGLALTVYIFGGLFTDSFVFIFVLCVLLLAFDFWTVKNISGRLLVGLRWWNRINEDGTNEWIFESNERKVTHAFDSRLFWTALYCTPLLWALFLIISVLKLNLQWALIVMVALLLNGANIVGYTKCKKDAQQRMKNFMTEGALSALGSSAGTSFMATIGDIALGNAMQTSKGRKQSQPGHNVIV